VKEISLALDLRIQKIAMLIRKRRKRKKRRSCRKKEKLQKQKERD